MELALRVERERVDFRVVWGGIQGYSQPLAMRVQESRQAIC